ncbi:MAG: MFS transporter, partial [Acidimicrobiales bacterium]|nr:MFS transporter [Acidimicrobiales bacterium]
MSEPTTEPAAPATEPVGATSQPGPLAPLSERNYRLFFIGNLSSNLGTF